MLPTGGDGLGQGIPTFSLEKAAILLDEVKLTTDVGAEVCFWLGKEEATRNRFYTAPKAIVRGVNNGGLVWSQSRFGQVSWTLSLLDAAHRSKPEMFQVWLSQSGA